MILVYIFSRNDIAVLTCWRILEEMQTVQCTAHWRGIYLSRALAPYTTTNYITTTAIHSITDTIAIVLQK